MPDLLQVKYADLDSDAQLGALAELVGSRPSEGSFRLVEGKSVPLVQR